MDQQDFDFACIAHNGTSVCARLRSFRSAAIQQNTGTTFRHAQTESRRSARHSLLPAMEVRKAQTHKARAIAMVSTDWGKYGAAVLVVTGNRSRRSSTNTPAAKANKPKRVRTKAASEKFAV